jgi:hypothetical protein
MAQNTPHKESHDLMEVREGMPIYDSEGRKAGTVTYVQFPSEMAEPDLMGEAAYLPNNMPPDMRARLLREGFVQIEGGLFSPDRFILPHQILRVEDDHIELTITKDGLLTF